MKWSPSIPLAMVLAFSPGLLLALQSQTGSDAQQPQDKPTVTEPSQPAAPAATEPSPQTQNQSMQDHFRACDQSLGQARNQAHLLARDASRSTVDTDALLRQHKDLQDQFRAVKENRDRFFGDLSEEQLKSIQDHNESMQKINDRIQNNLAAIDQELTGSTIHMAEIADQARSVEREMKSYQKHLQETGKTFSLQND